MSSKNFIIKNGLTIGTTEVIDSSGSITADAVGSALWPPWTFGMIST